VSTHSIRSLMLCVALALSGCAEFTHFNKDRVVVGSGPAGLKGHAWPMRGGKVDKSPGRMKPLSRSAESFTNKASARAGPKACC